MIDCSIDGDCVRRLCTGTSAAADCALRVRARSLAPGEVEQRTGLARPQQLDAGQIGGPTGQPASKQASSVNSLSPSLCIILLVGCRLAPAAQHSILLSRCSAAPVVARPCVVRGVIAPPMPLRPSASRARPLPPPALGQSRARNAPYGAQLLAQGRRQCALTAMRLRAPKSEHNTHTHAHTTHPPSASSLLTPGRSRPRPQHHAWPARRR